MCRDEMEEKGAAETYDWLKKVRNVNNNDIDRGESFDNGDE